MTISYAIAGILLNGLIFIVGACFALMGVILFIMTAMGFARKKLRGNIKAIKGNMVSRIAVLEVADEHGTREVEAELRSKSKTGDSISVFIEKRTGKYVEFNPTRMMVVGICFVIFGGLVMLPGII